MRAFAVGAAAGSSGPLHSTVLCLPAFLSSEDCASLVAAADVAVAASRAQHAARYGTAPKQPSPRMRLPIAKLKHGEDARRVVAKLHDCVLHLLEASAPEVAAHAFDGRSTGLLELQRHYTGEEPAINVYEAGGCFAPHQDQQDLTLLVHLSPPGAFTGGGTAFWPEDLTPDAMPAPSVEGAVAESTPLVVQPQQGDVLLWRGLLAHAGRPVESGTRHILVSSFSLLK